MKNPKQTPQQPQQSISPTLTSPLNQLIPYNRTNFISLSINLLKSPLQIEVRKISNKTSPKGQALLLIVLNNHVKAFIDAGLNNGVGGTLASNRRSFNQKNSTTMYQDFGTQFQQSDTQLHKLIITNPDTSKAQGVIELSIKYYTNRNYRYRGNKIIESRVRLLQLILSLLRIQQSTDNNHIPSLPQLTNQKKNTSFKQLQVSHVRLIVEELDQKVYELSTISQQIPQLETFKRTLDLTMPEHNTYLTKIVDVLIQLHHKVNKLISRRPEKLLKEIQGVENQCMIIEIATSEFIAKLQSQTYETKLKPIYFDQKTNKSPDYFRKIQKNVVKLSQFVIGGMALEQQAKQKITQIKSLVQVFWNLIAGMEEYERQWRMYKNRDDKSNDQQQIIQLLELCLKFINDRIQKMNEQFQFQRQALIDGNSKNIQYLQQDINRMGRENDEQRAIIDQLQRQNDQLREQLNSFDTKLKDLHRKHENDIQDYQARLGLLEKREKNYKDKIQSLESQNQQKKVMINNITNDLKRVMKESENTWKTDQKNKDLEGVLQQLNTKIEDLELELKKLRLDKTSLTRQKQQIQRNTDLVIKKLDQANRRVNDLQNQLQDLKHRHERQKTILKQQIQDLEKRNRKLNQQFTINFDTKTKQLQRKEVEQKQIILKKDQKISQLSDKIIDLNNKLSEIVSNYKNMQFELKRKQNTLGQFTSKIRQLQQNKTDQHQDLYRNYQKSQRQLNNALAQIQRCRNITVPELQRQIKRREEIIEEMQRIINELEQKQFDSHSLKRIIGELEDQMRLKDQDILRLGRDYENMVREKDARIRDLDHTINMNNNKIGQIQSQLRMTNQDKNKKDRELDSQITRLKQDYQRKLSSLQQQNTRLKQLQSDKEKQLSRIKQSQLDKQRELGKIKQTQSDKQRELLAKIKQLQADRDRELGRIRLFEQRERQFADRDRQFSRIKSSQAERQRQLNRLRQVEGQLARTRQQDSDKDRQLSRLRQAEADRERQLARLKQLDYDRERQINRLKQVQADKQRQLSRIRQSEQGKNQQTGKINILENQLQDKNRQLSELERKLKNLQNSAKDQHKQKQINRNLLEDLKQKQRQIASLKQKLQSQTISKASQDKIATLLKQIQFLKQKIRSLQDLVDILTQQHNLAEQKLKQYKNKLSASQSATQHAKYEKLVNQHSSLTGNYQRVSKQYNKVLDQLRLRDQQLATLKSKYPQSNNNSIYDTPINSKKLLFDEASNKKLIQAENEMKSLKDRLLLTESKHREEFKGWEIRQRQYVEQIRVLKLQVGRVEVKGGGNINGTVRVDGDKYYSRIQGEKLEDLVKRLQNGSSFMSSKLDQILSNSRKSQSYDESDMQTLISQNKILIEQIRKVIRQKQELATVIREYPNPEFLTQYVFRIITYFSQIHPESREAKAVWQQLQRIRKQCLGEQYFMILEEFTKFTLQECAIQVYRRELQHKRTQLQLLQAKLNAIIQQALVSEKIVFEKTALTESRVKLFSQKFVKLVGKQTTR